MTAAPRDDGAGGQGRRILYCVLLLMTPPALVVATILLACSPWFRTATKSGWFGTGDVAFTTRDAQCDVVLFGDSTAMTGLDPRAIERETHLATCNIAQTLGILSVLQFSPLDHFLAQNRRPKVLVLQFAAEHLKSFDGTLENGFSDGVYEGLGVWSARESASWLLAHPAAGLSVPRAVVTLALDRLSPFRAKGNTVDDGRNRPNVFYTVPQPARASCNADAERRAWRVPDAQWIQSLRDRYRAEADHVFVNVAPTPDCDVQNESTTASLGNATDNAFTHYPISFYNDSGERHYALEGSKRLSSEVARQILAVEHADADDASHSLTASRPRR
jgi:hypothetical protein